MKWNENDIEFGISCLECPEMMAGEKFQEWIKIPANCELFEIIRAGREAFLRKEGSGNIDVGCEYRYFMTRVRRRRIRKLKVWGGIAASVTVLLASCLLFLKSPVEKDVVKLTEGYTGRQVAELILANGERIGLDDHSRQIHDANGVKIVNDSTCRLVYDVVGFADTVSLGGTDMEISFNTIKVPVGADYVVRLSDGTVVHLNCETEFRYPVRFSGMERRVYLKGEAFFEVCKSEEKPFIVETEQMDVAVTGTMFNVKAYIEEDIVHTTLVEGGVKVSRHLCPTESILLKPSEQYTLNVHTGEVKVKEVDVQLYTSWVEGMFVFRNQRLKDIMDVLARWYSMEVFYVGNAVKDIRLSANLGRYEHIDDILSIIQATNKIGFVRKGNVVTVMKR